MVPITSRNRLAAWAFGIAMFLGLAVTVLQPSRVGAAPVSSGIGSAIASIPVLADYRLSSPYGMRHGRGTMRKVFHAGIDFAAPHGAPVFAARAGMVEAVSLEASPTHGLQGYGNVVVIHHEDEDRWTLYGHLDEVFVSAGERVKQGALIGRVGNTSNGKFRGMGSHLHFEVRKRAVSGSSPYPGHYRVNSLNPAVWLAEHGMRLNRRGFLA